MFIRKRKLWELVRTAENAGFNRGREFGIRQGFIAGQQVEITKQSRVGCVMPGIQADLKQIARKKGVELW